MPKRGPVLVLGCDTGAFLGVVRSLGRAGLVVDTAGCPRERPAGQSRFIRADHALPPFRGDGKDWIAALAELAGREGYSLVVPTSDSTLAQLAAARHALPAQVLALPSPEALAVFSDKEATRALAAKFGVPVADGEVVTPRADPVALARRYGLPLVVKSPRSYHLGADVQKTAVGLCDDLPALEKALGCGEPALVERFLPGFCRGISVLAIDGEVRQAFQHRRLRQEHRTGPSSWRRSEPLDPRLFDATERLVRETGYTGVAMFEFRFSEDERRWILLEVNPRFWGSLQLALDAGADYPAALHGWLVEGRQPEAQRSFAVGVEKRSAWGEYDNISERWNDARGPFAKAAALAGMARFVVKLARGQDFDSFAPDDPVPFRAERGEILVRLSQRLRETLRR